MSLARRARQRVPDTRPGPERARDIRSDLELVGRTLKTAVGPGGPMAALREFLPEALRREGIDVGALAGAASSGSASAPSSGSAAPGGDVIDAEIVERPR